MFSASGVFDILALYKLDYYYYYVTTKFSERLATKIGLTQIHLQHGHKFVKPLFLYTMAKTDVV